MIIVTIGTVTTYEGDDPDCKPHVYKQGMTIVDPVATMRRSSEMKATLQHKRSRCNSFRQVRRAGSTWPRPETAPFNGIASSYIDCRCYCAHISDLLSLRRGLVRGCALAGQVFFLPPFMPGRTLGTTPHARPHIAAAQKEAGMAFARIVAYAVAVFLSGIGILLLLKPQLATGPRGLPLLKGESQPMMAVLAAREIVLGFLAGGLAYTKNFRGLLLAFALALLITMIDAVALLKTKSILGFIINDVVGVLLIISVFMLWRDMGSF